MFYIIVFIFFLIWAVIVARKGHFSWHAIINIDLIAVFVTDTGDELFDQFFNFYDLPAHLLRTTYYDHYLGLTLSDGFTFPAIALVFCYYSIKYNRPWSLSILFSLLMGIIEIIAVRLGFMVYHRWYFWLTPVVTFFAFRLLAHYANRIVRYSPPISYRFWLICLIYSVAAWPSELGLGVLHFYQYRPHTFENPIADDRFCNLLPVYIFGLVAAYLAPKIRQQTKFYMYAVFGVLSVVCALWLYELGWLHYYHWNHALTIIRYFAPYLLIYWADRWELRYRLTFNSSQ